VQGEDNRFSFSLPPVDDNKSFWLNYFFAMVISNIKAKLYVLKLGVRSTEKNMASVCYCNSEAAQLCGPPHRIGTVPPKLGSLGSKICTPR
jgi:hypothetical protein